MTLFAVACYTNTNHHSNDAIVSTRCVALAGVHLGQMTTGNGGVVWQVLHAAYSISMEKSV